MSDRPHGRLLQSRPPRPSGSFARGLRPPRSGRDLVAGLAGQPAQGSCRSRSSHGAHRPCPTSRAPRSRDPGSRHRGGTRHPVYGQLSGPSVRHAPALPLPVAGRARHSPRLAALAASDGCDGSDSPCGLRSATLFLAGVAWVVRNPLSRQTGDGNRAKIADRDISSGMDVPAVPFAAGVGDGPASPAGVALVGSDRRAR